MSDCINSSSVRLSCPPLCVIDSSWTYLYPYANTPPRDLCVSSRGSGQDLPTRAMLLGCSDLISVAHTFYLNEISKTCGNDHPWKDTPLEVLCCDIEPCLIARSLLYLQLLCKEGGSVTLDDIAVAWEVMFSMFVTDEVAVQLRTAIGQLISCLEDDDRWNREGLGRLGVHMTGNITGVIGLLKWWSQGLKDGAFCGRDTVARMNSIRKQLVDSLGLADARDDSMLMYRHCMGGDSKLEDAMDLYRTNGFTAVDSVAATQSALSPSDPVLRSNVNPTFLADVYDFPKSLYGLRDDSQASDIAGVWRVHYFATPFQSTPIDLARCIEELSMPSTKYTIRSAHPSPATWCFELFGLRSEALVSALTTRKHQLVLHCGDAFALCDAIRPSDPRASLTCNIPHVRELRSTLKCLNFPFQFDYIDTSNIGDNTGILPILLACAPLLAPRSENPRATLATDVMKGRGNDEEKVVQEFLSGAPLWLIPFVCGLQLDFARSTTGHHDSAAKKDPSSLWMAYPRSFASSMRAMTHKIGAVPLRWRRCCDGFDKIAVGDSRDLKFALYQVLDNTLKSICERPVGLNTFIRLVDSLRNAVDPNSIEGLRDIFKEEAIDHLATSKPLSLIRTYSLSLCTLLSLHGGLYSFEKDSRVGRDIKLYDVTIKPIGPDWRLSRAAREKKAVSEMKDGVGAMGLEKRHWAGPDYRLMSVVVTSSFGCIEFPVQGKAVDGLHIIVPDVLVPSLDDGRLSIGFLSISVPTEACRSDAMVVRKEEIDSAVCFPKKSEKVQKSPKSPIVREWQSEGLVHFVVELRGNELIALQKKHSIEVRQRPRQPEIDVVSFGVLLASFTLPVEVAVNDVHIKVSRSSGKLDVVVPASYCCPLGPLTGDALPRCVFGLDYNKPKVSMVPSLSDKTVETIGDSSGWMNKGLFGRMLPLKVRGSKYTGMNQLRESLALVYSCAIADRVAGKSFCGRVMLSLARGTSSDVIMLLSPNVVYDGIHGLVIKGAVSILKHEFLFEVAPEVSKLQSRTTMRSIRVDESCGEFECWTEHYLPAAIELARVTRGIPRNSGTPTCHVCGSKKKSHRCKDAEKFWLSWLDWSKLPLSSTAMRHFEPMVIFPAYSSVMSYGIKGNEKSVVEAMSDLWNGAEEQMKEDPKTMDEIMRLIQQQVSSGVEIPSEEMSKLMTSVMMMKGSERSGGTSKRTTPSTTASCSPSAGVESDASKNGNRHLCATCGKPGDKVCSKCKAVYYCSIDCQRRGWSQHKKVCKH